MSERVGSTDGVPESCVTSSGGVTMGTEAGDGRLSHLF